MSSQDELGSAMEAAFDALRRYVACGEHIWRRPVKTIRTDGYGRHRKVTPAYETTCTRCGMTASRPTLEQLNAEVIKP